MVASAVFVLDHKGKVLISRDYRGDIPMSAVEQFMPMLLQQEEEIGSENGGYAPPIMSKNGVNFVYIKHNNVYRMSE